jgi:hypothetical protein
MCLAVPIGMTTTEQLATQLDELTSFDSGRILSSVSI